ncbi:MAG TPA: hypothetical protein VH025_09580 [Solirubrobacteraceae bacterium]|jgi:hypothetical protein|nr:hypothetical protein [Solirubrobacteraceae bacterium]
MSAGGQSAGGSGEGPIAVQDAAAGVVVPVGGLVATGSSGPGRSMSELRDRRRLLAEKVAELTWDLGGLTYEMAIRDHYRLDVLARRAAELQTADAELGEVQRLLAGAESGVNGQCRSCGAVHSRGAAFCWHCGAPLLEEARPSVMGADNGPDTPGG